MIDSHLWVYTQLLYRAFSPLKENSKVFNLVPTRCFIYHIRKMKTASHFQIKKLSEHSVTIYLKDMISSPLDKINWLQVSQSRMKPREHSVTIYVKYKMIIVYFKYMILKISNIKK